MSRLSKIVQAGGPGTGRQFRKTAYGSHGIVHFLRDVIAIANAEVDGNRYIVTGIAFDERGRRSLYAVDGEDFDGGPPYAAFVAEFIEPPVRIVHRPVTVDGQCIGVFEIGDCQDKPYMMRVDYSPELRRGDAYVRTDDDAVKVGRRALLDMIDRRPECLVPVDSVEIGFAGEVIRKQLNVPTVDLGLLPSAVERGRLNEYIDVRRKTRGTGSTSRMARLMHMRLFGADAPYEDRSPTGLNEELDRLDTAFEAKDQWFLFEENAHKLQLAVYLQGNVPVLNASLTLLMPTHEKLHVATRVPAPPAGDRQTGIFDGSLAEYPAVSIRESETYVASTLGDIPASVPVDVFESPLRICAGTELGGRELDIRYRLSGSNLGQPVEGRLVLSFRVRSGRRWSFRSG